MRQSQWFLVSLVAVIGLHAIPASANPIFYDFNTMMGGSVGPLLPDETFTAGLVFVDGQSADAVAEKQWQLHVGQSLSLTPADGQTFTTAVALATNGLCDFIGWTLNWTPASAGTSGSGLGTGGMRESELYHGDNTGGHGIDLAGIAIDEFRLTLDAVYTDRPGLDLNLDGNWTDYAFLTTFEIFGRGAPISLFPEPPRDLTDPLSSPVNPVPEPATLVLLGTGLLGTIPAIRRRRQKATRT